MRHVVHEIEFGTACEPSPPLSASTMGSSLGGADNAYPYGGKARPWQLVDDYSLIHGHHAFKAGIETVRGRYNQAPNLAQ